MRTGKIRWNDVKITEKEVLKACEKWKEENKSYPKYNSGKIGKRLTKNILKDDVWGSIDFALANGDIKSRAKSIAHLLEIKGLRKYKIRKGRGFESSSLVRSGSGFRFYFLGFWVWTGCVPLSSHIPSNQLVTHSGRVVTRDILSRALTRSLGR